MPRGYDEAAWERAHSAVVDEGETYPRAAELSGIDLSSLQKRAARDRWQEERRQRLEDKAAYRGQAVSLKQRFLSKAIETGDPQDVHAWLAIERALPEHRYGNQALTDPEKRALVGLFVEQLVDYLAGADANALAVVQPHLTPLAEHLLRADWKA